MRCIIHLFLTTPPTHTLTHAVTLPPPLDPGWCATAGSRVLYTGLVHLQLPEDPVRLHLIPPPTLPNPTLLLLLLTRVGLHLANTLLAGGGEREAAFQLFLEQ